MLFRSTNERVRLNHQTRNITAKSKTQITVDWLFEESPSALVRLSASSKGCDKIQELAQTRIFVRQELQQSALAVAPYVVLASVKVTLNLLAMCS